MRPVAFTVLWMTLACAPSMIATQELVVAGDVEVIILPAWWKTSEEDS